jgi:non-ribosomal peptide synthetase component F
VRIGLPLDGWDLAVVDEHGAHVRPGEVGELIIGGVGLARYLDPEKDAEKYAPFPTLGVVLGEDVPEQVRHRLAELNARDFVAEHAMGQQEFAAYVAKRKALGLDRGYG